MIDLLAQLPDTSMTDGLKPYGMAGVVVGFFMLRDVWRDHRDSKRDEEMAKRGEEREKRRDEQLGYLVEAVGKHTAAVNHLTRALTLEVLTRPSVVKRAKDEAEELSAIARSEH